MAVYRVPTFLLKNTCYKEIPLYVLYVNGFAFLLTTLPRSLTKTASTFYLVSSLLLDYLALLEMKSEFLTSPVRQS